jgi:hypothetical protein
MAEDQTKQSESGQSGGGLGFRALAMNEIAPQKTDQASEVGRRAGGRWLILVGVLAAAAAIFLGGRALVNLPPGKEAETRLRGRLMALDSWQQGVVRNAHYLSGNTLRVDFSTQLSTAREEARGQLRKAALDAMGILIQERPNRDLRLVGFQGEEQVLQAQYRQKTSLTGPGGEPVPDISVRVKGDPEGLADQVSGRGPGAE